MSYVEWPPELLHHGDTLPMIRDNTFSSGRSLTGAERVTANDAGYWVYSISTRMWTPDKFLAFRGMLAEADGRLRPIRVPVWDRNNDLAAASGMAALRDAALAGPGVPFSDGAFFSDGSGWQSAWGACRVTTGAPLRGYEIVITAPPGMTPRKGHMFSTGLRIYEIREVVALGGASFRLRFRTPLRAPIVAGSTVRFDELYCLMRISEETQFRIDRDPSFIVSATIDFVEAVA